VRLVGESKGVFASRTLGFALWLSDMIEQKRWIFEGYKGYTDIWASKDLSVEQGELVRERVKEIVTAPLTFYVGIGTDFGFPIALADAIKVIGQDPYFLFFNHRDAELDERITRYLEEIGASRIRISHDGRTRNLKFVCLGKGRNYILDGHPYLLGDELGEEEPISLLDTPRDEYDLVITWALCVGISGYSRLIASLKEGGILCADHLSEIIYNTTFARNLEGKPDSNPDLEGIGLIRLIWNVYQKVKEISVQEIFSQLKSLRHEEYIIQERKLLLPQQRHYIP